MLAMAEQDQEEQEQERGAATWIVDAVVALILLGIGAVVMYDSHRIGSGWGVDGPQSGYFPFYIGLLIAVSSIINFVQAVGKHRNRTVFVDHGKLRLVLAVLLPSIVYVIAIHYLGIYVASALFIGIFMGWQGKFRLTKILPVSLGVAIALFLMFEVWFQVPLPKGPLEAMFGY